MATKEVDSGDEDVVVRTRLLKVDQSLLSVFFVYDKPDRRKRTWVAEEIWTYIDRLHVTQFKEL
mgnify:CR=1 FL=1